ncbi:DUF6409 family protein [Streptomyces lonarensis]|uniref:Uncharacterized protein n=1 Tax=Streptomyces lonarensis TaxID=700599 RepID=A0A7X6HWZ7_9ACTN|nr:DUF6409 family protein [Streptomyces lonarensis]NJQ04003.1 hypothetical protein [Streptomyces lonarensis]
MLTTPHKRTVQDFPTATLALAAPWFRAHQLDTRPALVVGPFGGPECADEATMAVVWFFTMGAPEPGGSLQAMFPHELTPIDDTLTTMHEDTFRDIVRSLRRGRFAYDDGGALCDAVRRAWRERAGLADADSAARHTRRHN